MLLQDLEKHRDVAVTYVKYIEDSVLPLQDLSAPEGTRKERVEVRYQLNYSCHSNAQHSGTSIPRVLLHHSRSYQHSTVCGEPIMQAATTVVRRHMLTFVNELVQELDGYRSGSLVHYDKLKAWLCEEEYRLNFIKAHLAFALAMLQNKQVCQSRLSVIAVSLTPSVAIFVAVAVAFLHCIQSFRLALDV